MRTTVDLPGPLHDRVRELARERGESVSTVLTRLATVGLGQLGGSTVVRTDPRTGFPVLDVGHQVTSADVAELLDEE